MPRVKTNVTKTDQENVGDEQQNEAVVTAEPQTAMLSLMVELAVPLEIEEGYNDAVMPKLSLNRQSATKLKQITMALISQEATVECGGNQHNGTTGKRPRKLVQRPQDALTWLIERAEITAAAG